MICLGLDPSLTAFGWCLHDSSKTGTARIIARGRFSTSAKDIFVKRYKDLREQVRFLLRKYPQTEAVGVESPVFGEHYSEGMYALFVMTNEAIYDQRKDVVYFDPVTVKLLVKQDRKVRKGKMFKGDMVEAAKADTGVKGAFNHNEADAYHVARFAARFWELYRGDLTEEDLTDSERHVFLRSHTYQKGKRAGETEKTGTIFREGERFYRFSLIKTETANGRGSNG